MRSILTAIVVTTLGLGACVSHGALAQWTFETNPTDPLTDSQTITGIDAEIGSGTASGFHASTATDWSLPSGNGSGRSLNADNWSAGDYFQFETSTLGSSGISVTWEQACSATGPTSFKLAWSNDGNTFTDYSDITLANPYTVNVNQAPQNWNENTYQSGFSYSADLSSITALDNQSSIIFRLISTVGGAAAGTSRVDDFAIDAVNAVPEPAEWGLICAAGLLGVCGVHAWRERRRALRQSSGVS
jgi:hypothetical protein